MTKEAMKKAQVYLAKMQARLDAPVTDKHLNHPVTYRAYLAKEISQVTKQLDAAKLEGAGK